MKKLHQIGILGIVAIAFSAPLAAQHHGGHHGGSSHHGSSGHHSSGYHAGGSHGRSSTHHSGSTHHWGSGHHGYYRSHHHHSHHSYHTGYPYGGYGYYGPYPSCSYGSRWGRVYGTGAGHIDLDVQPEGARVFVDGEEVGQADDFDGYPAYLDLEEGRHRIELQAEGYEPLVREVVIRPGRFIRIDDELRDAASDRGPRSRAPRGEAVEQEERGYYDDDERLDDGGPRS